MSFCEYCSRVLRIKLSTCDMDMSQLCVRLIACWSVGTTRRYQIQIRKLRNSAAFLIQF